MKIIGAIASITILMTSPLFAVTNSSQTIGTTSPIENEKIYYHLTFPASVNDQTESITLNENFTDLIMSNFVAGAMYAHLIEEKFPDLKFDKAYLEGSLLSQLMQENLQTSDYQSSSPWINPDPSIRKMLLSSGQGGPYQLNDYSKRLEDKIGMINFAVLQKSLGYTISDQDSGRQTNKAGPDALDNKFFGPLAAAYFQFNDLMRLQAINQDSWGPSAKYFNQCLSNLDASSNNNFLDMIMNATYNAGPWADITKTYIELCANLNNPDYANRINHINDYTLNDAQYQQAVGTHESVGSTFILYPRQIRFYSDELYNNPTDLAIKNSLPFSMPQLRTVFANAMATLAYVNSNKQYVFISTTDAGTAFDAALVALQINPTQTLDIGVPVDREKIMSLLEVSITNLSNKVGIQFSETTENDLSTDGYYR